MTTQPAGDLPARPAREWILAAYNYADPDPNPPVWLRRSAVTAVKVYRESEVWAEMQSGDEHPLTGVLKDRATAERRAIELLREL